MYHFLKKSITSILPKKWLFKIEPFLRTSFSFTKKGTNHLCLICNFKNDTWITTKHNDLLCPKCGSLSRDRRLWNELKENFIKENISVLDFSPSRCLYRKWEKQPNIIYKATDFEGNFISDFNYDITNIAEKDATFDLIICYHVLEHIENDVKAMQELFRVLKPNGTLVIQTPFKEGEIYENYTITSEIDRLKHFGQEDHVRIYSVASLKERLENCNFKVENNRFEEDIYLGLVDETILISKK